MTVSPFAVFFVPSISSCYRSNKYRKRVLTILLFVLLSTAGFFVLFASAEHPQPHTRNASLFLILHGTYSIESPCPLPSGSPTTPPRTPHGPLSFRCSLFRRAVVEPVSYHSRRSCGIRALLYMGVTLNSKLYSPWPHSKVRVADN
ncbi:hypothetical protein BC835DRAFT_161177 [Cytidiella melzeri]|nr:hypothetical protein BC835DRAFT_161177 [Cytidiella melzeri]